MKARMGAAIAGAVAATLLAVLGGCAALPTINPDMAWSSTPVRVEGRRGPLSAEQSKAVLEKLKSRPGGASIFDRHLALEEAIVGSPLVAGNKTVLLQDGPRTYEAMLAAIRGARHHVNFETYIFEADEAGEKFADALIAKRRQGVQVNLMYDSVGSIKAPREFFQKLRDAGVQTVEFNPVNPLRAKAGWDVNQRDHRKLVVVDGRSAFVGGINVSSVYSGSALGGRFGSGSSSSGGSSRSGSGGDGTRDASGKKKPADGLPWRDTQLLIEGPAVAELQKLFVESWEKQKGPLLDKTTFFPRLAKRGDEVVRAIGSTPDDPYSLIYATLISAIHNAEKEVFLTNAYFVPDPQLLEAMKQAAARGVDVRLLLPSKTDSELVFHAGRAYYSEVLAAGIRVWERRDAMLHSKTALIDGVWSTVGSTNLDWRSFLHNDELNAVVLGGDFGNQMRAMFEVDLKGSQEITLDAWQQRPLGMRLKETFARVWQYWL
jgi:cardiolipin synthase